MRVTGLLLAASIGSGAGCASRPAAEVAAGNGKGGAGVVDVPRVVVTPEGTTTIEALFARAESLEKAGEFSRAAHTFEQVATIEPKGSLAAEAWFRCAELYDNFIVNHEAAIARYRIVADRYPEDARARTATARSVRLLTYVGDYTSAGRYADRLLTDPAKLTTFETIAVYTGKALALVHAGDDTRASSFVSRGRDVVEHHNLDLAGRLPRDVAPLYFALGEVYRLRSERVHFGSAPDTFLVTLEQRCQLILDAQRAYSDTWRAYDAHWSTLAGYRLAQMYTKLHEDVMAMRPPVTADTEDRRQLFEGAMRLRYSVLLEKARGMLEHTIVMAEREGERSAFVAEAKQALEGIRRAEQAEQAALARLPYGREQLEEVLAEIQRKGREARQPVQEGSKAGRQN